MPVSVQCSCGKRLNVKDEYLGKRIKCPACGETFVAAAGSTATGAGGPRFPGAKPARAGGPQSQAKTARLHVSPGIIALAVAAVLLPTIFFLYRVGPGHVSTELAKLDDSMKSEVTDVVDRTIQSYLSQQGSYNPLKAHNTPHTIEVTLLPSAMYMSMPESIGFVGNSTEGAFHGQYHLKSHEVQADVEIGGLTLPSGVLMNHGTTILHVTGRSVDGKISAEIDGKPAVIRTSPPEE